MSSFNVFKNLKVYDQLIVQYGDSGAVEVQVTAIDESSITVRVTENKYGLKKESG